MFLFTFFFFYYESAINCILSNCSSLSLHFLNIKLLFLNYISKGNKWLIDLLKLIIVATVFSHLFSALHWRISNHIYQILKKKHFFQKSNLIEEKASY